MAKALVEGHSDISMLVMGVLYIIFGRWGCQKSVLCRQVDSVCPNWKLTYVVVLLLYMCFIRCCMHEC